MTFSDIYEKKRSFRMGLNVSEAVSATVMLKLMRFSHRSQFRALGKAELADRISDQLREAK